MSIPKQYLVGGGWGPSRWHSHRIKILCSLTPQRWCSREEMARHVQQTLSLQRCRALWAVWHQQSMCSAWLGHAQLPALSSWEPLLTLSVIFFFFWHSQGADQVPCPSAAVTCFPSLDIFMKNSSALRTRVRPRQAHQAGSRTWLLWSELYQTATATSQLWWRRQGCLHGRDM